MDDRKRMIEEGDGEERRVLPIFGEQSFVADNVVFILKDRRPENLAPVQRVHVGFNRYL